MKEKEEKNKPVKTAKEIKKTDEKQRKRSR